MTTTASTQSASSLLELSATDCKEGIDILESLQTVERATRYNDDIPLVITNIFRNEPHEPELARFLKKHAGEDVSDQMDLVEHLLVLIYETL
jgi:hypothetical protein